MHLAFLLFALFASLFTLQKDTLNYSEPFFLVGSRMLFAGILMLTYLFIRNRSLFKFKIEHLTTLFLLALMNIYLTNIFEIWAINHMVSSKACLIYSLSPFIAALVAFFVLKERLSRKKWIGMLLGFSGLFPILFTQTQEELSAGSVSIFSLAQLSLVGAVFCSVYGWILLKKMVSEFNYSPLMANGVSMALGGALALGHSYYSGENWAPIPVTNFQPFIVQSLAMCLISNIICYNLYGYLLKRFTATFMSFAGLVTPIFASLFGWFFLGETITWHFFASIALFSCGLTIFYQEEIKQGESFKVKSTTKRSNAA